MSVEFMGDLRSPGRFIKDRRIPVIIALTLTIAFLFWFGSRYPQLNEKALMGGDSPISGLAFDMLVEVLPDTGFWWEVVANSINWMYTNRKGMMFGLLFGAALLTGLSLIKRRSFNQPFADAALGAAIGTPLGVCVNCAAPIAQGLHAAGTRLETTLAALIASPTLNVIVVSMSFALLPSYIAAIKLITMLAFIFIAIPLACRFLFARERNESGQTALQDLADKNSKGRLEGLLRKLQPVVEDRGAADNLMSAIWWVAKAFVKNLAFISIVTVPLMLVAGVLGAFLITALPFHLITGFIEPIEGLAGTLISMAVIACFAILLPVPIAFDVILVVVLVTSGWPAKYAIPMLIGLGSFSIYSFLIIGRAVSYRVAAGVMVLLAGSGFLAGVVGYFAEGIATQRAWARIHETLRQAPDLRKATAPLPAGTPYAELERRLKDQTVLSSPIAADISHDGTGTISVTTSPLAHSPVPVDTEPVRFTRLRGGEIGLDHQYVLAGDEIFEPFLEFWTVASGDIHGDGWDDIILAGDSSRGGLALFANVGGRFERQEIHLGDLNSSFVSVAALVDLNNDSKLDLFISTYEKGAHVFWNRGGRFSADHRIALPNGDATMMAAPAFADLDGDGDLDIVAGNWSVGATGTIKNGHTKKATDRILWNENGRFIDEALHGLPGETLTSLVTDVDGDGRPDIMIGDDVALSDKVYLNKGNRRFELVKKSDGLIPWMTWSTMSFDVGDIDNDQRPDLYLAQISYAPGAREGSFEPNVRLCNNITDNQQARRDCFVTHRARSQAHFISNAKHPACHEIQDPLYRAGCAAMSVGAIAARTRNPDVCAAIPSHWPRWQRRCELNAIERIEKPNEIIKAEDYIGGLLQRNVLLQGTPAKTYNDVGLKTGTGHPGWSWNAKFTDLDQDGWQDILVATGYLADRQATPNAFYRNHKGNIFEHRSADFGLDDYIPTTGYALIDYDRDGDLDIIRPSVFSEPIVHRNEHGSTNALHVNLRDGTGNRFGIGARITIRTNDPDTPVQFREMKASGGFASFDAPRVHFGLGQATSIRQIVVRWRDGSETMVSGPFKAAQEIHIHRRSD